MADRKFISRLFLNKAKDSGKVYLKGTIKIAKEELKAFLQGDGSVEIPVFGHTFEGKDKQDNVYKAYNLEVVYESNSKDVKGFKKENTKTFKNNSLDTPF
jgi:hypothetical protein